MLPARFVSENHGANVELDSATRCMILENDDIIIEMYINSKYAYVNGQKYKLHLFKVIEHTVR